MFSFTEFSTPISALLFKTKHESTLIEYLNKEGASFSI